MLVSFLLSSVRSVFPAPVAGQGELCPNPVASFVFQPVFLFRLMRYTLLYWQLIDHFDLTTSEYILLDTIHFLSQKTGWCYASRKELARRMRITDRSVYSLLLALEAKGLIEVEPRSRQLRCSTRWHQAVRCCNEGKTLPPAEKISSGEKTSVTEKSSEAEMISADKPRSATEKTSVPEKIAGGETNSGVQKLHPDSEEISALGEKISGEGMTKLQSATEESSYNHTNKNYDTNNKTNHTKEHTQTGVGASPGLAGQKEKEMNLALTANENFWKPEPLETATVSVEEKTPVVTPPPLAAAPSPAKPEATQPAKGRKATEKAAGDDTEPCLTDCRQLYLQQFPLYQWQHGRDDKFLKQVLGQIRYKIAARIGRRDLLLREVDSDAVVASFGFLIGHIPEWHRDNGYTTPLDLNRYFERYFTAIQSGQGGGMAHSLRPGTAEDLETVRMLLRSKY